VLAAILLLLLPTGAYTLSQVRENGVRARAEAAARFAAAADALTRQGKRVEARDLLRNWTEIQPANAAAWRAYGTMAAALSDLSAAETALQKAVSLNPQDGEAHLTLGGVHFARNDFDRSEAACRAALSLLPDKAQARLGLARALVRQNKRLSEAESLARQAARDDAGVALTHFTLAETLLAQGKGTAARDAVVRGLALDPANAHGFDLLARANRLTGDAAGERKAAETADVIRRYVPASGAIPAPIRLAAGEHLLEQGKYREALAEFVAVIERDAANAGALEGAGIALWALNDKATGSAYLTECLRADAGRVRARVALGLEAYQSGLYQAATRHFTRITEVQPRNALAWHALGQTLVARQLHDIEAEAALRQAVEIEPTNPRYWLDLAAALKTNNKTAEAEDAYRRGLALAPDDPEVTARVGAFLAQLPPDPAKRAEARTLLETSLRATPEEPYTQYHLGRLLVEQGEYAGGVRLLESASRNGQGGTKDVWAVLARGYRHLKQREKAEAALAEADRIQRSRDRYDRAVERLSSNMNDLAARLEMARASAGRDDMRRALAEYATYLRRRPEDLGVKQERDTLIAALKKAGKYPDMTLYQRLNLSAREGGGK
jgi:tetratricopeptide (TPR) repeat protein